MSFSLDIEQLCQQNVKLSLAESGENIVGKGIKCQINGKQILVGKPRFLQENNIMSDICSNVCPYEEYCSRTLCKRNKRQSS